MELARRAEIDFEAQHNHTTADAPETVWHVRDTFRRLELEGIPAKVNPPRYKGQPASMWGLIPAFGPPTRIFRWCCKIFKETGGKNRCVTTGVRWDESSRRKADRGALEAGRNNLFFDDNDESRREFEACPIKGTTTINPIVEWKNSDVWEFARSEHLQMNPLYGCGFSRVGCIGCPMASKGRYDEFKKYPKFASNYCRAFGHMLEARKVAGKSTQWKTAEDVFRWWMEDKNLDGQIEFEGVKDDAS